MLWGFESTRMLHFVHARYQISCKLIKHAKGKLSQIISPKGSFSFHSFDFYFSIVVCFRFTSILAASSLSGPVLFDVWTYRSLTGSVLTSYTIILLLNSSVCLASRIFCTMQNIGWSIWISMELYDLTIDNVPSSYQIQNSVSWCINDELKEIKMTHGAQFASTNSRYQQNVGVKKNKIPSWNLWNIRSIKLNYIHSILNLKQFSLVQFYDFHFNFTFLFN